MEAVSSNQSVGYEEHERSAPTNGEPSGARCPEGSGREPGVIKHRRITHNMYSLLPDLKAGLEAQEEVLFAYLFGSYGRGRPGP